jgi:hypothetical protein
MVTCMQPSLLHKARLVKLQRINCGCVSAFGHSSFFRHSSFVIRPFTPCSNAS